MNDPLPDGNENIVDIFVVSTCTSESPLQVALLENLGYRVTCFPETSQLFESLRTGKPNLLIADAVTFGDAAYELCHTLKADPDLWVIPVLVVTGASNLADLLHVLDCNADNFIATPCDPAYLSAVIEGLLTTQVERPTPDQIKTQFKIQHDGQLFVVTADRRRLLEFLLSSFEIAVSRSGEILRISARNDELTSTLDSASARLQDQDTALDTHARTIGRHEQSIQSLQEDLADRHRRIQDHTDEIGRLTQELKGRDARIALLEEEAGRLSADLQDLTGRYTAETGDLRQQVASLTGCLTSAHADLDAARASFTEEKKQSMEAEARLQIAESARKKTEEALQNLMLDAEQIRSELATEKARAESAEREAKTVVQAKSEAEEDLIRTINEFKTSVQKQDEEILHFKEALASRDARITVLESRAADLESEKTYAHAEMQTRAEAAAATISGLTTRIDEMTAALAAKEDEIGSRDADLSRAEEEKDRLAQELRALSEKLSLAEAGIAEAKRQHQEEMGLANGETRERDTRIGELTTDLRAAQDECESYRHSLEKIRYELEEVTTARTDMEVSLAKAQERIQTLEADHHAATTAAAGASQDAERLARELADARNEADAIRQQHHEAEQALRAERDGGEQAAAALKDVSQQRDAALQDLGEERRNRAELAAENERLAQQIAVSAQERQNREAELQERASALSAELDTARSACRNLELQVAALTRGKQEAEDRVVNLSTEIDQARTALADEWEDHMNARERLEAATSDTSPGTVAAPAIGDLEIEKTRKRSLIIKGPDLPMDLGKQVHAMSVFPAAPAPEPAGPRITNVEDLFEDEEPDGTPVTADITAPAVSIIHQPSDQVSWDEDEESPAAPKDTTGSEPEECLPETSDAADDEEDPDDALTTSPPAEESQIPAQISFNRAQWFDLLKWSHHAGTLSQEQRMQIVRMGRLIQQGRKLTPKQEEQVMEMLLRAQAQGFRLR